MAGRVAFAAFMDDEAKFRLQASYWARSLLDSGTADNPNDIFLFCARAADNDPPQGLSRIGIRIIAADPFDSRDRYCNKISLWQPELFSAYSHVCFNDCDVFFTGRATLPTEPAISAAVVDRPNPAWPSLKSIFAAAGLAAPEPVPVRWPVGPHELTAPTNCNGGFYLVSRPLVGPLGTAWARWARWLLENADHLKKVGPHVDQVSMALALAELKIAVTALPPELNVPTHLGQLTNAPALIPTALHYHSQIDPQGMLLATGMIAVDDAIGRANEKIAGWQRSGMDNRAFWNARYALFPELGSGVGSRGEHLVAKRRLLEPLAKIFRSTIDLGCGDTEVTRGLPFQDYLGVDIAECALDQARKSSPDRAYVMANEFKRSEKTAELVLCLDVALHQASRGDYEGLIELAVSRACDVALISGFDQTPRYASNITFFYEPVSATLNAHPDIRRLERVGDYRDMVVYAAIKRGGRLDRNQNQLSMPDLIRAYREVVRSDYLVELHRLSVDRLGFFTRQYSRVFEYTWLCDKTSTMPAGSRVLDVGAGICPLPIFLAERGLDVVTVDHHRLTRAGTARGDWNEWGFLDYATIHPRIGSLNIDILALDEASRFDAIYSISVIEHLRAAVRREFFGKLRHWLLPGGSLLMTVDLVPGSNDLWNRSEDKIVDDPAMHGTVDGLCKELRDVGLVVDNMEVRRKIYNSRTDVAFIRATRGL